METRLQIDEVEPKGFQSLFGIEKYLQQSQLTITHKELIKIRASQLNKCAFCIDMHTKDALRQGEKIQPIYQHLFKQKPISHQPIGFFFLDQL